MIVQYRLTFRAESAFRPEWAYPLYSALIDAADPDFAEAAHRDGATPVSQYLRKTDDSFLWYVTLFGDDCAAALSPLLDSRTEFMLSREKLPLTVTGRTVHVIPHADDLARTVPEGNVHLRFHTPTAFKSHGEYVCLPTVRLIVQSLLRKWNACMGDDFLFDERETDILADGLVCRRFHVRGVPYRMKGNPIPGFVGEMTFDNKLDGELRNRAALLMTFAEYAGVGIKTALGMGGAEVVQP